VADVSVLIRTLNEAEWIGRVLDAVIGQTVPAEVLVLDSGSNDGTLDAVGARPAVRLLTIAPGEFSYGRALNRGFAEASGSLLVALSGHALPVDDAWLDRLLAPFADPAVAAVYGRHIPHAGLDPLRRREVLDYWGDVAAVDRPGAARYSNANGALRADLWRQQPFDEALLGAEDHAWAEWALSRGHRVVYAPEAAVYHSHGENLAKRFRRLRALAIAEKTREPGRDAWRRYVALCRSDLRHIADNPPDWRWAAYSPFMRAADVLADRAAPRRR